MCEYCHIMEHLTQDCPELLVKLEEKIGKNIHMVTAEPRDRPIDLANVRVITCGGAGT
jgi:hypothetical protein